MTRRIAVARDKVPYLPKQHIENEAELLLAECGKTIGAINKPPIPIDDILEIHLKLTIEYKAMHELFPFGDVHGAIWMNDGVVGVDISLDPHVNPKKLGRYRFTLAHEVGHWRLHRKYYLEDLSQGVLFGDEVHQPAYVCRASDKRPVEWQADQFAANLLMPRPMVQQAWQDWRGNREPIDLADLRAEAGDWGTDEMVLANAVRPLADLFQVSAEAMQIRLEEMGLLLRKREASLFG